jgi:hypothetical protein
VALPSPQLIRKLTIRTSCISKTCRTIPYLVAVELADGGERHVVVGVDEHEVLGEEDVDDVGPFVVDKGGNAGVALREADMAIYRLFFD